MFLFEGDKNLVCRRMKSKVIASVCKGCPDPVCSVNRIFPNLEVEIVRKKRIKLNRRDPSFCQQCSMLLYDGEQMRDIVVSGDDNGLSEQCTAFGAADIEGIAKPSNLRK